MSLPLSYYAITLADNTLKGNGSPELTTSEFPIVTMTPADAAATETLAGNLAAAIAGITLGNFVKNQLVYNRSQSNAIVPSSNPLAQRENKWLFRYHDQTSFQKYTVSVGTADLGLLANNSEFLDLTAGVGAAMKTAFEAVVRSPADASHTIILDSIQFVGRNN